MWPNNKRNSAMLSTHSIHEYKRALCRFADQGELSQGDSQGWIRETVLVKVKMLKVTQGWISNAKAHTLCLKHL